MPLALRIAAPLLALLVGAAIGTVATFAHASLAPWVLAAGLLIVAAYVLGVRLAFDERMPGIAAAVGVGAAVVLMLVAAPLVAAAALLWPIRRRPEAASESP